MTHPETEPTSHPPTTTTNLTPAVSTTTSQSSSLSSVASVGRSVSHAVAHSKSSVLESSSPFQLSEPSRCRRASLPSSRLLRRRLAHALKSERCARALLMCDVLVRLFDANVRARHEFTDRNISAAATSGSHACCRRFSVRTVDAWTLLGAVLFRGASLCVHIRFLVCRVVCVCFTIHVALFVHVARQFRLCKRLGLTRSRFACFRLLVRDDGVLTC